MKHWSLGAKLTAWSALTVTIAIVLCGLVAGIFIHSEQIDALDEQLQNEAHISFGEFSRHVESYDWKIAEQVKPMLPLTLTERYVEVDSTTGRSFTYRATCKGSVCPASATGFAPRRSAVNPVRLGVFQEDALKLYLAADLDEIDGDTKELLFGFLGGLPFLLVAVSVGGWWLARKALSPMRDITIAAEEITAERLDRRLRVPSVRDEIGRLSTVLNEMFDRLDVSFRQAMRFSADASHELKTPLTLLRSSIEDLLGSSTLAQPDRAAIGLLLEQTRRLSSITESLLLLSRADAGQLRLDFKETNVATVVRACADDAAIMAETRGIAIETNIPNELPGCVDPGRMTQVLLNLLDNAIKYNYDGGRVRLTAAAGHGELVISVENTGPGIRADHGRRLFERFFRFEPQSGTPGHGLGLNLARELARAHSGDVTLTSSDAEWTVFSLRVSATAKPFV